MKHLKFMLLLFVGLAAQASAHPGDRFTRFAGFEFEGATLAEVQARIGQSQLYTQGDASEAESWVCYTQNGAEVQFKSGEMGGGTELLGVTLILHPPVTHRCPGPRKPLPLSLSGLKLGMSKRAFTRVIGTSPSWSGQTATASFEYTKSDPNNQRLDVSISIIGTFSGGNLVKLVAWKVEST